MEDLAKTFYSMLTGRRNVSLTSATLLLLNMPGGNHEKGIAHKLRALADELEKLDELPF